MWLSNTQTGTRKSPSRARKPVLRVEELEARLTPYSLSGSSWLHPELVSLSFVPDGTNLGGVTSNLFSSFNAQWPTATWQKEMLRSAQVLAQQTNLNFTIVADDGSATGSGAYQQGAGNFGDIRLGGFNGSGSWLGMATLPQPACNYSAGGDWNLNLTQPWVINQTGGFDLFTVAAHEMGHALGLYHSTVSAAVMYSVYNATKTSLRSDDISGIRAVYSAGLGRSQDGYDVVAANGTFATATDISNTLLGDLTALVTGPDITTVADLDYYKVTVPAGTTGSMVVKIQSSGLSLLSPLVRVYDANQVQVGSASGLNQYGATLTVTINGVSEGQQYYIMVDGADNTAFGTGKYGLTLNFGSAGSPTVPLLNTQTLNGSPIQCGGGQANEAAHDHDQDAGIGHGFGPARDFNPAAGDLGTAGVTQALVAAPAVRAVTPVSETVRDEQPAPLAVDSLFRAVPSEEAAVTTVAEVEADAADAVFADLFA